MAKDQGPYLTAEYVRRPAGLAPADIGLSAALALTPCQVVNSVGVSTTRSSRRSSVVRVRGSSAGFVAGRQAGKTRVQKLDGTCRDHPFRLLFGNRRDRVEVAVVVEDGEAVSSGCDRDDEIGDRGRAMLAIFC